jgi:hypothetical protein
LDLGVRDRPKSRRLSWSCGTAVAVGFGAGPCCFGCGRAIGAGYRIKRDEVTIDGNGEPEDKTPAWFEAVG